MGVKLSVIIASYNHEKYIEKTLKSIEEQTFQDFEIIIIDDGSPDGTVEAAKRANTRAKIIVQENQGVDAARNRGIEMAQGQYMCFIDSDDLEIPDRFERQVKMLDSDPETGLVFADVLIIDSNDKVLNKMSEVYPVLPGDVAVNIIKHYCFIPFATVMVRRDIFLHTGLFNAYRQAMGHTKWIEIAHLSKVAYDSKPLACWRKHTSNTSRATKKEDYYEWTRIELTKVLDKYPDLRQKVGEKAIRKRFAKSHFLTGFFMAVEGDIKKARHYYYKALKMDPLNATNIAGAFFVSLPAKNLITKIHRSVHAKKIRW
jgi:glycosyltransferase involved in cell wall biosynthesis